jgi:plastocyanin
MHRPGRLRRTRYLAHALLLAGLLWLIIGASPTTAADVQVVIQDFAFSPATITVPVGTTIVWTNNDNNAHTASSDTAGIFDTGVLQQGQSAEATFDTPGTYTYQCELHDGMLATIIVTDASSDDGTTTPGS